MRCLLVALGLALGLIASVGGARAQEFELPTWGGPQSFLSPAGACGCWGGIYVGGQLGYSAGGASFGNNVNDLATDIVRNTILEPVVSNLSVLSKSDTSGSSAGGFVGYNAQWEGVILGFEVNYSRTSLNLNSSDTIPPLLIANDAGAPAGHHFAYDLNLTASSAIRFTDLASVRARAGWSAGNFLPYAFLGLAIARADVIRSATLLWTRTDNPDVTVPPTPPIPPLPTASGGGTRSDVRNGGFYYGYAGGVGIDVLVMPNVFLRAEWEIDNFQSLRANVNNVRTAIGMKF
jgi:outer membrane immunogenic protein